MDILSADQVVVATQETLKGTSRDVDTINAITDTFVQFANKNINEQDEDTELEEVEATLPQKRARKKEIMSGEMAQDEALTETESAL